MGVRMNIVGYRTMRHLIEYKNIINTNISYIANYIQTNKSQKINGDIIKIIKDTIHIIENEYNNANFNRKDIPVFYSEVKVSFIDVLQIILLLL